MEPVWIKCLIHGGGLCLMRESMEEECPVAAQITVFGGFFIYFKIVSIRTKDYH